MAAVAANGGEKVVFEGAVAAVAERKLSIRETYKGSVWTIFRIPCKWPAIFITVKLKWPATYLQSFKNGRPFIRHGFRHGCRHGCRHTFRHGWQHEVSPLPHHQTAPQGETG